MVNYLYGAAVQGIQSFIFQTNKLREIVGASELVEEICTTKFASQIYECDLSYTGAKEALKKDFNAILFAAGNIKYIFQSKSECERIVHSFPKFVSEFAPGITVSQAVVKMEGSFEKFEDAVNELEKKLRTQRNKSMRSLTTGLMGILRSRQSSLPVVDITFGKNGEEHWDAAKLAKLKQANYKDLYSKVEGDKDTTQKLCKKAFGMDNISEKNIAHDIEDLTKDNDWIAIIHADGNGLGKIVPKIGTDAEKFKRFSQELDKATTLAAIQAYETVKSKFNNSEKKKDFIPIRPIVLGGDDLTVICRADLALAYTESFIKAFENETKEKMGDIIQSRNIFQGNVTDRLTVCAGIAYVKSSYPFYYAYELAEALCTVAKKDAKEGLKEELPKSCLMFHKVQDSFTEDWNTIAKRELTPNNNTSFQFGPYYISDRKDETKWLLDDLMKRVELLEGKEGNAVKSHLRNWISLLHDNSEMAKQKLERLKSMTIMKTYVEEVTKGENRDKKTVYPVYDILAIHTINNQKTK